MSIQEKTVSVQRILSRKGGGTIFRGLDSSGNSIKVIASYQSIAKPPEPGESWRVNGEYHHHQKFGLQFHAKQLWQVAPEGRFLVNYLTRSPSFRNIGLGEKKANDLWTAFRDKNESLVDHLDRGNIEALSEVINPSVAAAVVERWRLYSAETKVIGWLTSLNLDHRVSGSIMRIYGEQAIYLLQEDPYRLLLFMGWARVDKAAQQMGIEKLDRRRLIGAVEAALYLRLDHSHTLTRFEALRSAVKKNLGTDGKTARKAIEEAVMEGVAVGDAMNGYQLRGIARLEHKIKTRLEEMLEGESGSQSPRLSVTVPDQLITDQLAKLEAETGFPLNSEQREAISMAVRKPLCVISGGAGTGKTTVLTGVHKVLEKTFQTVYQMALSGRAAQRMRESTKRPSYTIAGFCLKVKTGKLEIPDNALFIVDEASMLDLPTMYRVLSYLPKGARLLLVGDPYQLPPIGFGLVFDVMVDSNKVPKVELKSVHRQTEESGIPAVATAIRNQHIPVLKNYDSSILSGVSFIDCALHEIPEKCWEVFSNLTKDAEIDPRSVRALSPIKTRKSGVQCLNELFQERFNPGRDFYGDINWRFAVDDPIIHLENDYQQDLYNGSLGVVEKIIERGEGAIVRSRWDDGEVRDIDESDIRKINLAYAMTIHKSQGSQFSRVIIPIEKSRILDNSMAYTALTRGVDQVVFVGQRSAFEAAVKAPPRSKMREVGFKIE